MDGSTDPSFATAQPTTTVAARTSKRWWGLDWSKHLPWTCEGWEVVLAEMDEVVPFIAEHYPKIFPPCSEPERWFGDPMTDAKQRFYREADVFLMRQLGEPKPFGVVIMHPTDWSTYYLRTMALLTDQRGKQFGPAWVNYVGTVLRSYHVDRLEVHTHTVNQGAQLAAMKCGFVPTGTVTSERYGALLHMTMHVAMGAKRIYQDHFGPGAPPIAG